MFSGTHMVNNQRYTHVAVALHWIIALAVFAMLGSGLALEFAPLDKAFKFQLIQWHKSLGVLVLAAMLLRVLWRVTHKPPALPANFKKFDVIASKLGHWGLYLLLFIMPISGWAMVSSSHFGLPTIVFGWFEWPHIPGIAGNEAINGTSRSLHGLAAWVLILLIIGHVAAVVKHILIDRVNLLPRMGIGKIK